MRKHLNIWGCLVMCLTMAACQGDDGDEPVNEKPVPEMVPAKDTQLTFTAEFDGFSATRALWNDAHVAWSAGDKVRVYPMASSNEYYTPADFSTQKGGQTADFTGKVENAVLSKTNTFYAFIPSTRWRAKCIHEIVGEDFDYKTFISQDEQYNAIQKGTANRGTEGLVTTTYNGLTPNYNTSTRSNYVEMPDEVYPPLPAPTFKVMKETALDMRPLRHIH